MREIVKEYKVSFPTKHLLVAVELFETRYELSLQHALSEILCSILLVNSPNSMAYKIVPLIDEYPNIFFLMR